jgi:hypothetical protein
MVTTINTYIKTKKHSPVDPSILEPDHRQGGRPGTKCSRSLAKKKPTETPEI